MRGSPDKKIVVRLDPHNVARLRSRFEYDPRLSKQGILFAKFFVDIPRRIEVLNGDTWELYPSVTSLKKSTRFVSLRDGIICERQFGKHDKILEEAAEDAGIYVIEL